MGIGLLGSRLFGSIFKVARRLTDMGHSPRGSEVSGVQLLDVVELRAGSRRWPAGQRGTVIEDFGDMLLVEISDESGRGLDFLELPREAVQPVHSGQERLALT